MDTELLAAIATDVAQIKWILLGIAIIFAFICIALMWISFYNQRVHTADQEDNLERLFIAEARKMKDTEKFYELIDACNEFMETRPDSSVANYYLGLAYLRLNELAKAKACYTKLRDQDPHFRQVAEDALVQIAEALENSGPRAL